MSVRLTWANNSSGHDGTYVYRSTSTMDPQALPAPIADLPAGSEEYIDSGAVNQVAYHYRVQDHEGGNVSTVSDEVVANLGPDYTSAQIGDEIGGGIYAGTITYADAREYHIVAAKSVGEGEEIKWGNYETNTGARDSDDGLANQQEILTNHDDGSAEAFYHCRDYVDDNGNSDYYLPARNELGLLENNLAGHAEFVDNDSTYRWSSTETSSDRAWVRRFDDDQELAFDKIGTDTVRPIRRIAV